MDLKSVIRNVPNFPVDGIMFRDITTVLQDKDALKQSVDQVIETINDIDFDVVVGPESRGFIFGMPVAYALNKSFVPIRKKGKLPFKTISKEFTLEYGSATIEMHIDAIKKGDRVIITDDLLATGGTCSAIIDLVEQAGGVIVGIVFFIELLGLNGRENFKKYEVRSVLKY